MFPWNPIATGFLSCRSWGNNAQFLSWSMPKLVMHTSLAPISFETWYILDMPSASDKNHHVLINRIDGFVTMNWPTVVSIWTGGLWLWHMHPRCALGISARAGADQHWSGCRRVQRLLSEMFAVDVPREWERSNFQGKNTQKNILSIQKTLVLITLFHLIKKSPNFTVKYFNI